MDFSSFFYSVVGKTGINKMMHLSIFVDDIDETLKNMYVNAAKTHNNKILEDPHFYDAGFDLFLPKDGLNKFLGTNINKIDFKVKCSAKMVKVGKSEPYWHTPFYTYARSSISKTPLRLANNQGIIDAGYRGNLIGMFDCIGLESDKYFTMENYSRILQICAPELLPIYVTIVDKLEDLGPSTSRGEGGIGSTGK